MYDYTLLEKLEISEKYQYKILLEFYLGIHFIYSSVELSEEELNSRVNDLYLSILSNIDYDIISNDMLYDVDIVDKNHKEIFE